MLEDVTYTRDGHPDRALGTPEGNAWVRESIERIEDPARRAVALGQHDPVGRIRRDAVGILEVSNGLYLPEFLRAFGLRLGKSPDYPALRDPGWLCPYGVTDDLDTLRCYVRPYADDPARRFLVEYWTHRRHTRAGTGPGMVLAAVNGHPVSCAVRWRKTGPYVGTRSELLRDDGAGRREYLCDEPYETFLLFRVHEWPPDVACSRVEE